MRLLLLGGTGQVGTELRGFALPDDVEVVAPKRSVLDLQDASAIANVIAAEPWSAVINCAAYTEVDRAESDEPTAFAVNAEAPARLAAETAKFGIPLLTVSTDYVFDGRKGRPYREEDPVAPLNAYGRTKLAGEKRVREANPRHVILRTSWLFSPYGRNFVKTILRLAAERDRLTIVADQRGCPTAAHEVARACLDIAIQCVVKPEHAPYGVYHFAGGGEATWFDFAREIVHLAGDRLVRLPQMLPIRTGDYPTAAVRPADTRLDCSAVGTQFGVAPSHWQRGLEAVMDRLLPRKGLA
ncbi:MAG TPA: dTDP-4-dehydrorhamnose reductase [Xanthobacteraceae bacterium]|jgi:dTDP-4-dehydrorhamnose reductase|nr:dTDP-4-dehydrorhamnose reductase [Xanthobacteraceae bacterium]